MICIISPVQTIPADIWDAINVFPDIYVVTGSPLDKDTLHAANIKTANKAVILGFDSTIRTSDVAEEMMDAQPIFVYKAIKSCNPAVQILTELQYEQNIDFLLPKSQNKLDKVFSTLYAAGEVYLSAIIDTLTAQTFYNPHIVTILQQILVGRVDLAEDKAEERFQTKFKSVQQSNLWQI